MDHVKYYVALFEKTCSESLQGLMYVQDAYQNNLNLAKLLQTKSSKLSALQNLLGDIKPLGRDITQVKTVMVSFRIQSLLVADISDIHISFALIIRKAQKPCFNDCIIFHLLEFRNCSSLLINEHLYEHLR